MSAVERKLEHELALRSAIAFAKGMNRVDLAKIKFFEQALPNSECGSCAKPDSTALGPASHLALSH
jgi:hypothetical protein